jgi:hypothetical protein
MSQSKVNLPVSKDQYAGLHFSESLRKKLPTPYAEKTVANALWILRNPIRLSSEEKAELVDFVRANLIGGAK